MTRLEHIQQVYRLRREKGGSSTLAFQECINRLKTYEEKQAFEQYVNHGPK